MPYSSIIFERLDNIAKITLNRPDKLNALNRQIFEDIEEAISEIELDSSIKAVILTGSGEKAFAAGADISELNECDQFSGKLFSEFGSKIMHRLENLRVPVIAAVNGFALGGGCELTLACHIRFASTNAKFGQPEVNLGVIPGYGGTQRLTRYIGKAQALELLLTADMINAEKALTLGLVNEVVPIEELIQRSRAILLKTQTKSPLTIAQILKLSNDYDNGIGFEEEIKEFGNCFGTEDFKEGTDAFLNKRAAAFTGK